MRVPFTIEDLERWEDHGALWRVQELSDERAVVQLCTCYGEPVEHVRSSSPELIDYLRARRDG